MKNCLECNVVFNRKPKQKYRDYKIQKFCSIKCAGAFRSKASRKTDNSVKEIRDCVLCKNPFTVRGQDIQRCCSIKCSRLLQGINTNQMHMSQEEVAERLVMTKDQVARIEAKALIKLANVIKADQRLMEIFRL